MSRGRGPRLPLLVKELRERAASSRTYTNRVWIGLFFAIGMVLYLRSANSLNGNDFWEGLVALCTTLMFIFLPAICASSVTAEKERDSLGLLFLTDLSGWEIILQKFLGSLIPCLSLILLILPLGTIAYGLGGLETKEIFLDVFGLALLSLLIAAIGLRASCAFRTTVSATVATYLLCLLIFFLIPIIFPWVMGLLQHTLLHHGPFNESFLFMAGGYRTNFEYPLPTFYSGSGLGGFQFSGESNIGKKLIASGLLVLFCLLGSRSALYKRAFVRGDPWMLRWFKKVDSGLHKANRAVGNIQFGSSRSLPTTRPVQWRETNRLSLGNLRYLIRWWLPLQVLVFGPFLLFFPIALEYRVTRNAFGVFRGGTTDELLTIFLWMIVWLVITLTGVNAFQKERRDQTLEILRTTPLSPQMLIKEKATSLARLIWLVTPLLATPILIRSLANTNAGFGFSLVRLLLFPTIFLWIAIGSGLRCKNRFGAWLASFVWLLCLFTLSILGNAVHAYLSVNLRGTIFDVHAISSVQFNRPWGWWTIDFPPNLWVQAIIAVFFLVIFRALVLARGPRWLGSR